MLLWQQQAEFTKDVASLIDAITDAGYFCTFGECYRTPEQALQYAKQGKGIIDSLHCKRLAVDLNLYSPQGIYLTDTHDYEQFGTIWEKLDPKNRWGGYFKTKYHGRLADGNHFERVPE